jgi:hypothetical protein
MSTHPRRGGFEFFVVLFEGFALRCICALSEEDFYLVDDLSAALAVEDFAAEGGAAGDAVGEPAGELLHAADGVALGAFVVALEAFA